MKYSVLFILFAMMTTVAAKVDPPNYDFSHDQFQIFMPGKKIDVVKQKYPKFKKIFDKNGFKTIKVDMIYLRYKFGIYIQYKEKIITDFHARLPAYFLHDIFHQSLINRLGPQDVYKKVEDQAYYIWKNKNNLKHIYLGACSITCFPVHYSVIHTDAKIVGANFKSLIDQMEKN